MNLTTFDKAIVAGLTSAIVALVARFGFQPDSTTTSAIGVILTAVVPYVIAHVLVYFKSNKSQ